MAKYRKAQKVQPAIIIGVISFFVVLIALIVVLTPSPEKRLFNNYIAKNGTLKHDTYFKNHAYKVTSVKDLEKMIEKEESFILLIGNPNCQFCVQGIGAYNRDFQENSDVLESHVGKKLFYLDSTRVTQELYDFVMSTKIQTGSVNEEEGKVESPQLVYFKDGKLTVTRSKLEGNYSSESARSKDFFKEVLKKIN